MNFRKVNNIAGWVVFALASLVYILTSEMRGSFWDCGEFVSACYKVQLPHPPGAPLFVLLGRFFIIIFGNNPMSAAKAVNIMNALASGATILFLFWTITHFARKLMSGFRDEPTPAQTYTIIGAGIVGGLAYTFSDSFWFSAVEGEVYALSSLFTALAFWSILKWERADDAAGTDRQLRNRADRWIVFLFFTLGLSIGIHLLGLLVIPAAVMVYYFKRYNYTRKGAIWAFVLGCLITGIVQVAIIQWTVKMAGWFDRLFVNGFSLPFFSGFIFFFLLVAALVVLGLRWANRRNWSFLRLGLWCFTFMMLGYSTYVTTMERSNANPALDMNNVDNPMSLVYYLGRDQYGSQPILYGPHFLAQPTGSEEVKKRFTKGKDKYIEIAPDRELTYESKDYRLFSRVWDSENDNQRHADYYMEWLNLDRITARTDYQVRGIGDGIVQVVDATGKPENIEFDDSYAPSLDARKGYIRQGRPIAVKIPTYADNIRWFMTYQMGFMYWRYFMWNFAGKQNDIQGAGNKRDGNWLTGISLLDNQRLGDQSMIPDSIKHNKEHNKLFLLPFLLGVIGCVYQFIQNRRDWVVSFLLFFFTGVAIVVYLNQAGNQPRERDYAFAGSFYAYAIWIGLAVVALVRMAREQADKKTFNSVVLYSGMSAFVILLMSDANNMHGGSFIAAVIGGLMASGIAYLFTYALRYITGRRDLRLAGLVATLLCITAPIIMGAQEWDVHDRSRKLLAPDIARDYLEGCPKDAILFTFGDNDTYPLWYAQEVEGVRPDVRIVNTSLLGIDWYVNQLRYKVNESPAFNLILKEDQILGFQAIRNTGDKNNQTQPLDQFLRNGIGSVLNVENNRNEVEIMFPSHLTVPVDTNYVRKQGLVMAQDSVVTQMQLDVPPNKSYYQLDQLAILDVIASTNWKRPVCFTNPSNSFGLGNYLRQEGLIYTVVPVLMNRNTSMDVEKTKILLRDKFRSGNANLPGVYFDEENRRHLISIRETYSNAVSRLAEEGRKDEAIGLLDKAESLIHPEALPYGMVSRNNMHNYISMNYLEAAYKAGHKTLIAKVKTALEKDLNDQLKYYRYLRDNKPDFYNGDLMNDENFCTQVLEQLKQFEVMYNPKPTTVTEIPGKVRDTVDSVPVKQ